MTQAGGPPLALIARSIRRERDRVGLSLSELAKRAGIAKSTLSQLESGTGNPSVETLWALAVALGVQFSRLVDPPRPTVTVIRSGEGPAIPSERANYVATLLAACPPGARRDIYAIQAGPGSTRQSDPHVAGTMEHVWIGSGKALVGPADDVVELSAGDYAAYPGDVPHVFEATEPGTACMIVLEHI